jgi:Ca-activated chloride channel homolog
VHARTAELLSRESVHADSRLVLWRERLSHSLSISPRFSFPLISALALLLSFPFASPTTSHPQQATEPIRISVGRVNVGVIVTDSRGNFVEGLHRADFHVFDNGIEQPLTDFAALDEPAQVVLLIESGPAVYLFEGGHLRAARALLDGLSAGDRVAIVTYAKAPEPLLGFTADKQLAAAALDNLRFDLGFGQLNLSSSLSAVLDGLASEPRKKTVVLLSTGVDTSPESDESTRVSRLKLTDVRVLAVSLTGEMESSTSLRKKKKAAQEEVSSTQKEFAEANQHLKLIAESTGGRAYFPKNAKEFSAAYAEIAQLVRHEYSLAFTPPTHDGQVHSIELHISDSRVGSAPQNPSVTAYRIDHRRAYLAPTNQ